MCREFWKKFIGVFEKYWILSIVLLIWLFAGLSLYIGMKQSVWFDEAYSIMLAKHPINDLIHLTAIDVHPPVYYIFLHFWGNLFGFGELSLRLSSIIMMSVAIFMMAVFLKMLFSKRFAIFTTLFLCLSPMLVRYGFEIRMYAAATIISVLATLILFLLDGENQKLKRRILQLIYAGLVALGMLTLYYTIVIWLTHLAFLIYRAKKENRPIFKQDFWLVYILSVIFFSPWFLTAIKQFTNGALAPISERMTITNIIGVFSFNFLYRPTWQLDQIGGLLILIFIITFILLFAKTLKNRSKKTELLMFLAVGPIMIEFMICLVAPMYVERYLVYSAPFLIALICYLLYKPKFKIVPVFYSLLLLILGIINLNQIGNFNFQRMQKPAIREVAEEINKNSQYKTQPILADSPYEAIELNYYLGDNIYFYSPYDNLAGGYASLDKSKMQIKNKDELKKFNCFNYVYYDENLKSSLDKTGFTKAAEIDHEHSLKSTVYCRK